MEEEEGRRNLLFFFFFCYLCVTDEYGVSVSVSKHSGVEQVLQI